MNTVQASTPAVSPPLATTQTPPTAKAQPTASTTPGASRKKPLERIKDALGQTPQKRDLGPEDRLDKTISKPRPLGPQQKFSELFRHRGSNTGHAATASASAPQAAPAATSPVPAAAKAGPSPAAKLWAWAKSKVAKKPASTGPEATASTGPTATAPAAPVASPTLP